MKWLISKLTYANLIATLALFLALGGIGYAAVKLPKNSIHTKQLANSSVTSPKVKDGTLLKADLAPGVVPDSPDLSRFYDKGESNSRYYGKGETDSRFYDKSESDSRFLGKTATAADSERLGSLPPTAYTGAVRDADIGVENKFSSLGFGRRSIAAGGGPVTVLDVGLLGEIVASCTDPAQPSVHYQNTQGAAQDVWTQNMVSGTISYESVSSGSNSASVSGSAGVEGAARYQFIVGNGADAGSGLLADFDVTMATAPGGLADNSCLVQVQSQELAG